MPIQSQFQIEKAECQVQQDDEVLSLTIPQLHSFPPEKILPLLVWKRICYKYGGSRVRTISREIHKR